MVEGLGLVHMWVSDSMIRASEADAAHQFQTITKFSLVRKLIERSAAKITIQVRSRIFQMLTPV